MNIKITTGNIEAVLTRESSNSFVLTMDYSGLFNLDSPFAQIGYNESLNGWVAEFQAVQPYNINMYKYIVDTWIPTYGIQRRIPVTIEFTSLDIKINDLYMSFDPTRGYSLDERNQIIRMPIVSKVQDLSTLAGNLPLRKLYNNDLIPFNERLDTDRQIIRHILQDVPDARLAADLAFEGLLIFYIWKDLIELGKTIFQDIVGSLTDAANPVSFIANAIKGAVQAGLYTAVVIEVTKQTVEWAKRISDALFEKPKAFYCMPVNKIFEKSIKHILGNEYTFKSSILESATWSDLNILPATDKGAQLRRTPINNPVPNKTFAAFISDMSNRFGGAKLVVNSITKEARFDRIDFFFNQSLPTIQLQDIYETGQKQENTNELITSLQITQDIDNRDSNTSVQVTNADMLLTDKTGSSVPLYETDLNRSKELSMSMIPALSKVKETAAERIFNSIWDFANNIANVFSTYKVNFNERIGYMVLEKGELNTDRIFHLRDEKVRTGSYDLLSTDKIYEEWQLSLANNYQFTSIFGRDEEQFCDSATMNRLFQSPFFINQQNNELCCFTKIEYRESTGMYTLEYRIKKQYITQQNISFNVRTEKLAEDEKITT